MSIASSLASRVNADAPSRPIGVMRVIIGSGALLKLILLAPLVFRLADPAFLQAPYWVGVPRLSHASAIALCVVWAVSATAFLLGVRTRVAGAILTMTLGAVLFLDQQLWSNHLYLLTLLVFLVTAADSGASVSFDARRHGIREHVSAGMVMLIGLQLSVVYFYTAVAKVTPAYLSGTVLRWNIQWFPWAGHIPTRLLVAAAVFSIAVEIFLSIGIWIAAARPFVFVLGAGLHAFTVTSLEPSLRPELSVFALITLSMYLPFVNASPQSRTVVWDDNCTFCRTWVRWFRRLDWLRVHRFVGSSDPEILRSTGISREEADRAIQLVSASERLAGFAAVRAILEVLPVSFLWAPVLRLPPIVRLGDRGYEYVASRRMCRISIDEGVPRRRSDA
jgi:predicted DCC family thiol-disulfide oxidoreductase YuxK